MTDDPLTRLRTQLVEAADAQASGATIRRWWRRPVLWAGLAVLVGAPAAATAAGLIDLSSRGTTADGSTYSVRTITDAQASTDPARRDGVGRICTTITVRGKDGQLDSRGLACRPRTRPRSRRRSTSVGTCFHRRNCSSRARWSPRPPR